MRAGAATAAFLSAHNTWYQADLYTLTLLSSPSSPIRWTTADTDIIVGGVTWQATGGSTTRPLLKRGMIRWAVGLEVSTLDLRLHLQETTVLPSGQNLAEAASNQIFHGAHLKVERVIMETWGTAIGGEKLWLFEGDVTDVEASAFCVALTISSDLAKLSQPLPKRTFAAECQYEFCGAACGLTAATYQYTSSVRSDAGNSVIQVLTQIGATNHFFQRGWVKFTSGELLGITRTVLDSIGPTYHWLYLDTPLPSVPAAGDTMLIMQGCARTLAHCTTRGNQLRFPGFVFAPGVK